MVLERAWQIAGAAGTFATFTKAEIDGGVWREDQTITLYRHIINCWRAKAAYFNSLQPIRRESKPAIIRGIRRDERKEADRLSRKLNGALSKLASWNSKGPAAGNGPE